MSDKVIFRRVHGHIVPIVVREGGSQEIRLKPRSGKERSKSGAKAAAALAAGVAAAAYGGKKSGQFLDASEGNMRVARAFAKSADLAVDSMNLAKMRRSAKKSVQFAARARAYSQGAKYIKKVSVLTGAALIAGGVHEALSNTNLKEDKKTKVAIAGASGVAAHFALQTALAKSSGFKFVDALIKAASIVRKKKLGI